MVHSMFISFFSLRVKRSNLWSTSKGRSNVMYRDIVLFVQGNLQCVFEPRTFFFFKTPVYEMTHFPLVKTLNDSKLKLIMKSIPNGALFPYSVNNRDPGRNEPIANSRHFHRIIEIVNRQTKQTYYIRIIVNRTIVDSYAI
jgi:hypothetical protein